MVCWVGVIEPKKIWHRHALTLFVSAKDENVQRRNVWLLHKYINLENGSGQRILVCQYLFQWILQPTQHNIPWNLNDLMLENSSKYSPLYVLHPYTIVFDMQLEFVLDGRLKLMSIRKKNVFICPIQKYGAWSDVN